jgi:hypothetical protein
MAPLPGAFALLFASIVLPSMIVQDFVALPGQRLEPRCRLGPSSRSGGAMGLDAPTR